MTIRYEINPPKVSDPPSRIELLDERIEQISKFCDGIHVTDSVLGIERISPLLIGAETVSYTHLTLPTILLV